LNGKIRSRFFTAFHAKEGNNISVLLVGEYITAAFMEVTGVKDLVTPV
jgi:hypothetical protein